MPMSACVRRDATIAGVASEITPEQARRGELLPDRELAMIGAQWLAAGYESPALVQLASLGRNDLAEARTLFETALEELGYPRDQGAWLGHWGSIDWACNQVDTTHSPYAAAQRVLEAVGDVPDLWKPGRGQELMALLREWDTYPARRSEIDDALRHHLRSLKADDRPPTE